MRARSIGLRRPVGRSLSSRTAASQLRSRNFSLSTIPVGFRVNPLSFFLNLLCRIADKSFVQRSALITGLSLAFCGLTLAGIGEWASGRFDSSTAESASATALAASSSHDGSRVAAATIPALPDLPDSGDHLPAGTPGYTFRRNVPEVRLQFTVADQQGRLVQDLSPDDVRIFDNQSPVPRFSDFQRDRDLPLHLGLILDTSDSVKRVLPEEKTAAVNFLTRVMRPQSDAAFLMGFGGDVRLWQASTANRQELIDAIARLKQPGWGTRMFDALYSACSKELAPGSDGQRVHRAIIVLTDGDDTESFRSLGDVVAVAERSEIQIYALTIHAPELYGRGDRILQRLADATGGRLYVAKSSGDLDAAFAQIEQDLRTQYYVSFPPQPSTPGFHRLRIEVRPSQRLEVHARQGYYALAE
jgi:Ca-activated chloride channel homolog